MKILKKDILIILILILSLISVACDRQSKDINEKGLDEIEGIGVSDSNSEESQDPYLIKLDAIGNQIIDRGEEESVQEILNEAYEAYGDQVENIYYGNQHGKMLLSPQLQLPEDYDARQRPWYKKALEKELFKPAPYLDQSVEKNIQTIAKALYKGDELIGVIGMDYVIKDSERDKKTEYSHENNEEKYELTRQKEEELKNYIKELSNIVENEEDPVALKKYFEEIIENSNLRIETIYLANKNEIYLIIPYIQLPDNYDPSIRPWYESAIKENIFVSDIFSDVVSNKTLVTVSTKVSLQNDTIGVLSIDFDIDL